MSNHMNFASPGNRPTSLANRPAAQDSGFNTRSPTATDAGVGARIRNLRRARGSTLKEIAGIVGVTGAQLHRYETGATRVAASRLLSIASALGVPPQHLMAEQPQVPSLTPLTGGESSGDLVELVEAYSVITDPRRRGALLAFARAAARDDNPTDER